MPSRESAAATTNAECEALGDSLHAEHASLPAATTTTIPCCTAFSTAFTIGSRVQSPLQPPPSDMEITLGPCVRL